MLSLYAGKAGPQAQLFADYRVIFSLHLSFRLTILGLSTAGELQKKFPPAFAEGNLVGHGHPEGERVTRARSSPAKR